MLLNSLNMLFASVCLVLVDSIHGHGNILRITIGDDDYPSVLTAAERHAAPYPQRITRWIQSNGPMKPGSDGIMCNQWAGDVPPASEKVAEVAAGSDVTFHWTDLTEYVNKHGPVMNYLAACEDNDCATFEPLSDRVWFKISEDGFSHMGSYKGEDGQDIRVPRFGSDALALEHDNSWTVNIPEGLRPGEYLLRHEFVALHLANEVGGVELYPSCTQLRVTGAGRQVPTEDSLVAFPEAYSADDPGLHFNLYGINDDGDVFFRDIGKNEYTCPGPRVAKFKEGPPPEAREEQTSTSSSSTTEAGDSATDVPSEVEDFGRSLESSENAFLEDEEEQEEEEVEDEEGQAVFVDSGSALLSGSSFVGVVSMAALVSWMSRAL